MPTQDIYIQAFHAANIGTCITDETGCFVEVNKAYCNIYGYTRNELIGKHFSIVVPPENRPAAAKLHDDFFNNVYELPSEWVVMRKDGQRLNIFASAGMIVQSDQRYKVTKVTDITDIKEKELLITRLGRIIDQVDHEIYIVDTDSYRFQQVSMGGQHNLQYDSTKLQSMFPWDLTPEIDQKRYTEHFSSLRNYQQKWVNFETIHCRKDGTSYPVDIKIQLISSEQSPVFVIFAQDITQRKRILNQLKKSEILLKEAQSLASIGSWNWDIASNEITWSDETYRIFGLDPNQSTINYEKYFSMIHPDDRDKLKANIQQILKDGKKYSVEHRIITDDQTERFVHGFGDIQFDTQGKPLRIFGTVRDLTHEKQIAQQLQTFNALLEKSIHIVFITKPNGTIVYVNPKFESMTGYLSEDVIGQPPNILLSSESDSHDIRKMWDTVIRGKTWNGVVQYQKKNGQICWAEGLTSPIQDESNEIISFLSIFEDISEQVIAQEKAQYLESFDRVSGLMNRSRFTQALSEKIQTHFGLSLILINVNDYALVSDTYGINFADEFIRAQASQIKNVFDIHWKITPLIMGRISEANFSAVFKFPQKEVSIQQLQKLIDTVSSIGFSKNSVTSTISLGIAHQEQPDQSTDDLIAQAFMALKKARKSGRNNWYVFQSADLKSDAVISLFKQKEFIFPAIKENRFEPWFQPILDLHDNEIHHYEALARMYDTDGNIVLPGAFIPAAEELGLIGNIDRIIAQKTIMYQKELLQTGHPFSFSMNISGKNLGDSQLLAFLQKTIIDTQADPRCIIFEITETAAINDLKAATHFIQELKKMGCQFSLDDFGVGFTSFIYLRELNVDFIKIDGMFVRNLHQDQEDQSIVKAITMIAKEMKIRTIAEFVENKKTLLMLQQFGIDYAQGYLIGKPMPTAKHS